MWNLLFFLATDLPRHHGEWFLTFNDTFLTTNNRSRRAVKVKCVVCGEISDDAAFFSFEVERNESYGITQTWSNCYLAAGCGHVANNMELIYV